MATNSQRITMLEGKVTTLQNQVNGLQIIVGDLQKNSHAPQDIVLKIVTAINAKDPILLAALRTIVVTLRTPI